MFLRRSTVITPKYWDKEACANSIDQDLNAASDLGLHCLPPIQQFEDASTGIEMDFKILGEIW